MSLPSRSQKFHGVNLTGWLIPEPWISPQLFAATGALDDDALLASLGRERYNEALFEHRNSFITQADFNQIAARGFDAVRLPVPWHVFGEYGPMPGVREGCLEFVDAAFDWAEELGIKILVVLASAPGSQLSSDGLKLELDFTHETHEILLDLVAALSQRYATSPAFLGLEPLEEVLAQHREGLTMVSGVPLPQLRSFYREAYHVIREMAGERCKVVFSDAGLPSAWRSFMAQREYHGVWLDAHLYRFADHAQAAAPAAVRALVMQNQRHLAQLRNSGLPLMVGEWSAALPLATSATTPEGRIALERSYISAQLSAFKDVAAWFFQTWKTEGKISSWDARVALASFERGMFA